MAMPASGPIKFSQLQSTFGGSNPVKMSEHYRNGGAVTKNNLDVPTNGVLKFSKYYNTSKLFTISSSSLGTTYGIDLRATAISLGWNQDDPVETIINNTVGSTTPITSGITVSGSWPRSLTITVNSGAAIYGAGGAGGRGTGLTQACTPGENGGTALTITNTTSGNINLSNSGVIAGGGGGGGGGDYSVYGGNANGGSGGGGGAGYNAGAGGEAGVDVIFPGSPGGAGTLSTGGIGGISAPNTMNSAGGDGGGLGQPGTAGYAGNSAGSGPGARGEAGVSILGYNRITNFLAPWDSPGPLPGIIYNPTANN